MKKSMLIVSATVWALGYMTQVPSHLSLTPGQYVRGLAPTTLAGGDIELSSRSTIQNTILHTCSIPVPLTHWSKLSSVLIRLNNAKILGWNARDKR
jgi:hypothetical protein